MKAGAEGGVAAARWPWARGGDYGQESSLPPATLLLPACSGLAWGVWGLHIHPSAEETHRSLGSVGKCSSLGGDSSQELLLVAGELPEGVTGTAPSPCSQARCLPLPRAGFRGRRHSRNL